MPSVYTELMIYPVPRSLADAFLWIRSEQRKIHLSFGGVADVTLKAVAPDVLGASRLHGLVQLFDRIKFKPYEDPYLSLTEYKDQKHFQEVTKKVWNDPEWGSLRDQLAKLVTWGRIVRVELEQPVPSQKG